jgi:N-acetylneuraminate synthase
MEKPCISINGRVVGQGHPVYIIAEISANHNQDFNSAVEIVHAAKASGADAVKVQTYTADTMTISSDKPYFRISGGTLWDGTTLHQLYQQAYTPWEWQPKLKAIANDLGMDLFSTAFDASAVEFLERMEVPVHKIASFENVDIPLIREMAKTGKPLIISTGMASLAVIEEAVHAAREAGANGVALLKCTSAYPAQPEEMNLRTIPNMADVFQLPVGLSDHTMDVAVPAAAVALGACIVEKHLTLSRAVPGPDTAFSLEPQEFAEMARTVRVVERAVGRVQYGASELESKSRTFLRSLFVVMDVAAGEFFTTQNVRSIRPGHGLHPRYLDDVLGRRAARNLERGTPLSWDAIGSKPEEKPW